MNMNDAQTVFTLFYGVYFAVTVALTAPFNGFDTPAMYAGDARAWFRFGAAFLVLNIVPLLYFVTVFVWLAEVSNFAFTFWSMFAVFFLSIAGFGFYRVYFGLMLLRWGPGFLFYGAELPHRLEEELKHRVPRHRDVLPHVVPGIIWVLASLAVGRLWIAIAK